MAFSYDAMLRAKTTTEGIVEMRRLEGLATQAQQNIGVLDTERRLNVEELNLMLWAIIHGVNDDPDMPLLERAAVDSVVDSARPLEGLFSSLQEFRERVIGAYNALSSADEHLRTLGAPVVAFRTATGPTGVVDLSSYAVQQARGNGLDIGEIRRPFHRYMVAIPETTPDERFKSGAIVDSLPVRDLVHSLVTPDQAAEAVGCPRPDRTCVLIGDEAVYSFFEQALDMPHIGATHRLLGAAAQAGIIYPPQQTSAV